MIINIELDDADFITLDSWSYLCTDQVRLARLMDKVYAAYYKEAQLNKLVETYSSDKWDLK